MQSKATPFSSRTRKKRGVEWYGHLCDRYVMTMVVAMAGGYPRGACPTSLPLFPPFLCTHLGPHTPARVRPPVPRRRACDKNNKGVGVWGRERGEDGFERVGKAASAWLRGSVVGGDNS